MIIRYKNLNNLMKISNMLGSHLKQQNKEIWHSLPIKKII